jgi:hypothetical protein
MRNGGDITVVFQFLCFATTVSVSAIGRHAQGDLAYPAGRHNDDRMTIKRA